MSMASAIGSPRERSISNIVVTGNPTTSESIGSPCSSGHGVGCFGPNRGLVVLLWDETERSDGASMDLF